MAYPMGSGGGAAGQARQEEMQRQARIREGTGKIDKVFGQFDDSFYGDQVKAYEGYALPEVERQFLRAGRDATFALADRGQLRSGTRDTMRATLDVEKGRRQREVSDAALSRANELRGNVEDQRSRLVSQVIASGDPSNATQSAIAAAGQFQRPSAATPLGQFFADWSNTWLGKKTAASEQQGYDAGANAWGRMSGPSSYNVGGP